ncbi:hypothetical protein IH970_09750 [candidate division KSB1 bacterium]|nr:hypothetical protein [candidate division KSB1 bacterium]
MMKRWLFLFIVIPTLLFAQEKRWLQGKVVSIGENNEETAEENLKVTIDETGDSDITTTNGRFRIFLPAHFKAGEKITLSIKKEDYRVQYPLDGELRIPVDLLKDQIKVRLLPVGSPLFWTHDRIEKFIADLTEKSKEQVVPEAKPKKVDFGPLIKEWASKYGFSAQEAEAEIDKWITAVEEKQNDTYKLALAAFAKRNFGQAAELFHKSGEFKSKQLKEITRLAEELEEKKKKLTAEAIQAFRKEGDSHYNNYQFKQALTAYEKTLIYVSREESPQAWFDLTLEIAGTNRALGIRTAGTEIQKYLDAGLDAYRDALTAIKKTDRPEQWAAAQIGIGNVLAGQGIRRGGEPGGKLLGEAVDAFRLALQVYTPEHLAIDWARTHYNLGRVLFTQSLLEAGDKRTQLLKKAVDAYQQTLKMLSYSSYPTRWADTQNLLAKVFNELQDWPKVAASYDSVLKVYHDDQNAYQTASLIYHEVLFNYDEGFILNQNWLARHPDDQSAQLNFAEKHFTTGRFSECETRIAEILENPEVAASSKIALQAVGLANATALGKLSETNGSLEQLISMVSNQVDTFKVSWQFNGTRHFIDTSENEHLATHRDWLLSLFQALEGENRQAILAALRQVQASWQQVAGKSK